MNTLLDCAGDFGPFDGRIWLNASHQGPLPRSAIEAGHAALELKRAPHVLTTSAPFDDVPTRLRSALAQLLGADESDIVLGNSASYGLHTIALGFDWREGDEVLLVDGDFPSTTLPWKLLRDRGVTVRSIAPGGSVVTPDEVRNHLTSRTRIFCTTWVHSFTGYTVDEAAIAQVCRENGTHFVLNASQAVGARPCDVNTLGASAVLGVGFKWLCGPYGTGYCWLRSDLRDAMHDTKLYWLAHFTADDLKKDRLPELRDDLDARKYDVFGTANFNNFMPWIASIEYMNTIGIERIAQHDQALVDRLLAGLDASFAVRSPRGGCERSTIVILSHVEPGRNERIFESLRAAGIDNSFRRGNLRFAPHLYNTPADIDAALEVLAASR